MGDCRLPSFRGLRYTLRFDFVADDDSEWQRRKVWQRGVNTVVPQFADELMWFGVRVTRQVSGLAEDQVPDSDLELAAGEVERPAARKAGVRTRHRIPTVELELDQHL